MGDRTSYSMRIPAGLPDALIRTALRAFYEDAPDLNEAIADARSTAGAQGPLLFCEHERYVGQSVPVAVAVWTVLARRGVRAPFTVWSDPAYGQLGEVVHWDSQLGAHAADCDDDGTVVVSAPDVGGVLADAGSDASAVRAVEELFGLAWDEAFERWGADYRPGEVDVWVPGVGESVVFRSPYTRRAEFNGVVMRVARVVELGDEEEDREAPTFDVEVGGRVIDAWGEELYPVGSSPVRVPADVARWGRPGRLERVSLMAREARGSLRA